MVCVIEGISTVKDPFLFQFFKFSFTISTEDLRQQFLCSVPMTNIYFQVYLGSTWILKSHIYDLLVQSLN